MTFDMEKGREQSMNIAAISEPPRYRPEIMRTGADRSQVVMVPNPSGLYVFYLDHVAAISKLTDALQYIANYALPDDAEGSVALLNDLRFIKRRAEVALQSEIKEKRK